MIEMIKKLTANQKTIIMADRGYETYNIFANIQERGLFYLIRIKDTSKKAVFLEAFPCRYPVNLTKKSN